MDGKKTAVAQFEEKASIEEFGNIQKAIRKLKASRRHLDDTQCRMSADPLVCPTVVWCVCVAKMRPHLFPALRPQNPLLGNDP